MQVDGYSLDAQKDKLHKYADYQDIVSEELWNQVHKRDRKPVSLTSKPKAWIMSIFYPELSNVLSVEVVCMAM